MQLRLKKGEALQIQRRPGGVRLVDVKSTDVFDPSDPRIQEDLFRFEYVPQARGGYENRAMESATPPPVEPPELEFDPADE